MDGNLGQKFFCNENLIHTKTYYSLMGVKDIPILYAHKEVC